MITTLLLALAAPNAHAEPRVVMQQPGAFALGLGNSPAGTGASGKLNLTQKISVQGMVLATRDNGGDGVASGVALGADALYRMPELADFGWGALNWHLGAGVALGTGKAPDRYEGTRAFATGLSAIGGLELDLRAVPLDISVEARPSFGLPPDFDWDVFGTSAHVRYWF